MAMVWRYTNLIEPMLQAGAKYDLVVAAGKGDLAFIKQAMSGVGQTSRDTQMDEKALSFAANIGQLEVVDYLLDQGVTARLADMVLIGYLDEIQRLIDGGADVNVEDENGYTPLDVAAIEGQNEAVKLLAFNGADLDATDFMENAYTWERFDSYELLIDLGVDPQAPYKDGSTALHWAANCEASYTKFLLEQGVDVNAVDDQLSTPLHRAAYYENLEVLELLIASGANLDAQDKYGETPLLELLGWSDAPYICLKALLAAGANPDIPRQEDSTPLLHTIGFGKTAPIELLLKYGVDVDYITESGDTALSRALLYEMNEIAAILREHGAKEPSEEMLWDIEHQEW